MKLNIKEIKRINIKDGDIIFIPKITSKMRNELSVGLHKVFPDKVFVLVNGDKDTIKGIKVINVKGDK